MVPLLEDLAQELAGRVEIVKFNCNKNNKELGVALGIKVAPTFQLYRAEKQVRYNVCGAVSVRKKRSTRLSRARCLLMPQIPFLCCRWP